MCGLSAKSVRLQGSDFREDGQKILASFHDWVKDGASGAEGWVLEKENSRGLARVHRRRGRQERVVPAASQPARPPAGPECRVRCERRVSTSLACLWSWRCISGLFCYWLSTTCADGKQHLDALECARK